MSGLVGLWNLDGRPVDPALAESLAAAIEHRGLDGVHTWISGSTFLGISQSKITPESLNEIQPLLGPGGSVLIWDGRLDNRGELLSLLPSGGQIDPEAGDSVIVTAAHDEWGDRAPERLQGDFAYAHFEPRHQRLLLVRDPIGIRSLYFTRVGRSFVFASEIKALLAHPRVSARPDHYRFAQYLLNIESRVEDAHSTYFEGISSVGCGRTIMVSPERMAQRVHWEFDPDRQIRMSSFEDYVGGFKERFQMAVSRRLRSAHPVAISVSGGLDSTSIFCQAVELGGPPDVRGFTFAERGDPLADETHLVAHVEQRWNVEVDRLFVRHEFPIPDALRCVSLAETPYIDPLWSTRERYYERIQQGGARVLLEGLGGDEVMFGRAYLLDLTRRLSLMKVARHLTEYPRWLTEMKSGAPFLREYRRALVRSIVPSGAVPPLRAVLMTRPPNPFVSPSFAVWGARAVRSSAGFTRHSFHSKYMHEYTRGWELDDALAWMGKVALDSGLELATPFLDRDLISFAMAIPGETLTHEGVPKAMLRRALQGLLPSEVASRRWKGDWSRPAADGLAKAWPAFETAVRGHGRAIGEGFVEPAAYDRHLAHAMVDLSGGSVWGPLGILGVETWLDTF